MPRFFERTDKGIPSGWLEVMRASIAGALWQFSTARMLSEYVDRLYHPAVRKPGGHGPAVDVGTPIRSSPAMGTRSVLDGASCAHSLEALSRATRC